MPLLSPARVYRQARNQHGFVVDPAQEGAVNALETCYLSLHSGQKPCSGVYLWGPVGRGKTWLMDAFHRCLQVPSRRQHFHHFMQWVHRRLFALSGTVDPLRALATELAGEIRVLCFDELFVSDIGDAMLLGRLFQAMFDAGVVLVATSNQLPEQLYADGFNRERFLPAITAIQSHMQVVEVDGGRDYRLHPGASHTRYWVADPEALFAQFIRLSGALSVEEKPLRLNDRPLPVVRYSPAAIWLRFDDLCSQPFAAVDFIELLDRFPAILLSGVPRLSASRQSAKIARGTEDAVERVVTGDRELPALSTTDDSVRRFIALVDECYDRRVPLYIEAAVPLVSLYTEGYLEFSFRRTLSRLQEMQLRRFQEPHIIADPRC
jgi:cell division protein ZapE